MYHIGIFHSWINSLKRARPQDAVALDKNENCRFNLDGPVKSLILIILRDATRWFYWCRFCDFWLFTGPSILLWWDIVKI